MLFGGEEKKKKKKLLLLQKPALSGDAETRRAPTS